MSLQAGGRARDGEILWYLSLRQASFPVLFEDVLINPYVISQLSADLGNLGSQLEHWWYLGDQILNHNRFVNNNHNYNMLSNNPIPIVG
jgi:hypothetical protein